MSEVSFGDIREAGGDLAAATDAVQARHDDVADALRGGAEVAGTAYADAGAAYATEAAPRLAAALAECVAVLRDVSTALSDTSAAYQHTEESVVQSLKSIPTPWT